MASKLSQSISTHTRLWYLIDARGQVVGRLATMIALLLQGKTKPIYHPAICTGDHVVVVNASDVVFSGKKWNQKLYRHHTGYPGGFREILAKRVHEKDKTMVLRKAVNGMLPKNTLRRYRMRRLYLFSDDVHPYVSNIYKQLEGPCALLRGIEDYDDHEIKAFPQLVTDAPHL